MNQINIGLTLDNPHKIREDIPNTQSMPIQNVFSTRQSQQATQQYRDPSSNQLHEYVTPQDSYNQFDQNVNQTIYQQQNQRPPQQIPSLNNFQLYGNPSNNMNFNQNQNIPSNQPIYNESNSSQKLRYENVFVEGPNGQVFVNLKDAQQFENQKQVRVIVPTKSSKIKMIKETSY